MQPEAARDELAVIQDVLQRTRARVDPHLFHCVHWGAIVLVWYPLANYFQDQEQFGWMLRLGIAAVALGFVLSAGREFALVRRPRLEGDDTFLSRQIGLVTLFCIGGTMVLSGMAPSFELIDGRNVPILWGLAYAALAYMIGVLYDRAFLISGTLIFAASLAAIVLQPWNGYILGPAMGLGMIVPGLRAEARVRVLARETPLELE
jgi:hypothetical protein